MTRTQAERLCRGDIVHYESDCRHKWRVNGALVHRKRDDFWRIPIKHGLYEFGYIEEGNVAAFHREGECGL